jgi:hypothetical protein
VGSNPTLSATQSRDAEASRIYLEFDRENPAIPRGFAKIGYLKRTGDGGFGAGMRPRSVFFSVARLDGSLSPSIRPREEPVAGVTKSHLMLELKERLDLRVHSAPRLLGSS